MLHKMKLSAIHNLVIQKSSPMSREGLILPKSIMGAADLQEYEQIIITRIRKDTAVNRIRTIVLSDDCCDVVVACGSVAKFIDVGDLTCIISETLISEDELNSFNINAWPILDVGFDPETNVDNCSWSLELQYHTKKVSSKLRFPDNEIITSRSNLMRTRLATMIYDLKINKTHPNCLQGSAEIPASVLVAANVAQYSSVSVYNATVGGVAETYAVATPEGVVMTTGAMESFAKLGDLVNVATFELSSHMISPRFCYTDGAAVKCC